MAWMNCPETWWQILHAKTLGIQRTQLAGKSMKYMEVFSWDNERSKFDYMLDFLATFDYQMATVVACFKHPLEESQTSTMWKYK